MGSINFIGSTNDGGDDKQSQRYDFDYTDPEKEKSNTSHLKPKASFFGRRKKNSVPQETTKKKEEEAKFVEKEQVRKGKYKPTATKQQSQKSGTASANTSAVYAPTRGSSMPTSTQSSVQPTFAQINRTESIVPHSQVAAQPVIAPQAPVGNTLETPSVDLPLAPAVQPNVSATTPTPQPTVPTAPPTPTPSSLPQPQVFPATPASPTTINSATPNLSNSSKPVPTASTKSATPQQPLPTNQVPLTIPVAPPPPVHAAPLPASAKTSTVAPSMQGQQQSGNYKMYDTSAQVRQDAILRQPIQTSPVVSPAAASLQPAQNPSLPHLSSSPHQVQPHTVANIPTPPAPPSHVPSPAPSMPASPQPMVQPMAQKPHSTQQQAPPTGLPAGTPHVSNTAAPLGQPAAPRTVNTHPTQPGVVHAQNVESMHGQKTDPEPITGKFLAVNLLPVDFLKELSPASKVVGLIKVALISCTLLGIIYGVMVGYQSYFIIQTKNNQLEINRLETEILTYVPLQNEINSTNAQLESVSTLLARHIYWSNVFTMLEEYTLPNVYYQNFSGNTTGLITLQAVTTDFSSVSRQVHIFNNEAPFIQSAVSTTAARSDATTTDDTDETAGQTDADSATESEAVSFTINLHLDPSIFLYQSNANNNGNN